MRSGAIVDALADLHEAVGQGRSTDEAIQEIAKEHGIEPDALRARASREGGIIDCSDRIKGRTSLVDELRMFEREGLLFGYPLPDFPSWRRARGLGNLGTEDAAFVAQDLKLRRERAAQAIHKKTLMEISRGGLDAEAD